MFANTFRKLKKNNKKLKRFRLVLEKLIWRAGKETNGWQGQPKRVEGHYMFLSNSAEWAVWVGWMAKGPGLWMKEAHASGVTNIKNQREREGGRKRINLRKTTRGSERESREQGNVHLKNGCNM